MCYNVRDTVDTHSWGGAAKTYEYAKKKDLQLINLAEKELL